MTYEFVKYGNYTEKESVFCLFKGNKRIIYKDNKNKIVLTHRGRMVMSINVIGKMVTFYMEETSL